MHRTHSALAILLLLPLWLLSTTAQAAPTPTPAPAPPPEAAPPAAPNPYDTQPGVPVRREPPARPAERRTPTRPQARDTENPVTQPPAPAPRRYVRAPSSTAGLSSVRYLLLQQSLGRIKSFRSGRNWGIGLTVTGGILVTLGGLSVIWAPMVMIIITPIGGLALLAGIPLWATMQSIMNAEKRAIKRLRRYRFQPDSYTPQIASSPGARHLQTSLPRSPLQLRF